MMTDTRFVAREDFDLALLAARVPEGLRFVPDPVERGHVTWLDTFDWRLWEAGGRLVREDFPPIARLVWSSPARSSPDILPTSDARVASDLPATIAGREISSLLAPRALLPLGEARVERRSAVLLDERDKTVARVTLDDLVALDLAGKPAAPPRSVLRVAGLVGYESVCEALAAELHAMDELAPDQPDELALAVAARGRTPGDYSSKLSLSFDPAEPAERALRTLLGALLDTVERNVDGVRDDVDVEFLHDLRVAVRRSRAAVGQLRLAIPASVLDTWRPELRWLGDVTGPCRDLDVFLIDVRDLAAAADPSDGGSLDPFLSALTRQRHEAHRRLVEALSSERFAAFLSGWRAVLKIPFEAAEEGERPILELARQHLRRAFKRVVKHGKELGPHSPPAAFHRLRIDAKKLRYLLEFFSSLFPAQHGDALVKELKKLQDVLGGLQDVAVQRERLLRSAETLHAEGAADAVTLLTMGRMTMVLDRRELDYRQAFHDRFDSFAGSDGRATFAALVRQGKDA